MISISKLLCGRGAEGDGLRYDDPNENYEQIREEKQKRPVVVWNTTRRCNLYCEHCYAGADLDPAQGELSTAEAKGLIDDLAAYDVPVLLFSGGEPLVREDLVELVDYATDAGIRAVLSTNGTLITEEKAAALRDAGLSYAGVSVDGLEERNDRFRGKDGAFDAAVRGIENCLSVGLKTGLRYTITEHNAADMEDVVDLLYDVGVDRFCFYHLDYGGRGGDIADADLDDEAQRRAVRRLFDMTREYHEAGENIETLLVGNYADSAYVVEYAEEELGRDYADEIHRYLRVNGGDPTGERVADVDYRGDVHLTQFWQSYSLGNVRDRPFGDIWDDESNPLLAKLREREQYLTGKCATCQYQDVCRGSSRLRSLAATGELFGPDPQCYLTPEERGVTVEPAD
ncbi:radical SAM/SPASM domain-containing protein [Haloferax mediterranei ATCC 33500]|uniref:Fe-S osidoreductase n=1 Tax=Haloferax mediterranei (strain ATCC 33500 / DSM 1411 / JCM 8866 / NBRC 14739 / NCIMB 2177 / R-4) TaxID=523841 RepID=I3R3N5_HALMT|nr:TIGR04347 family pseudo-SAM/SPASM protein [Haloferax mediterranei]AFK18845.1 heme biosynthesis protein [Haloferax mediterranei ATCC 33500]AHZ21790.1 Fe-S osidoreductase [Haloferax mediterranei ATCC 33500]EMA03297.1 heme biosynthesis protein [Haloferax mediterranei ATCC 33500]MDX5988938.1 TIGR04347 family pseudo-SAM/SPASM protein [Haloferax mediterranei ATCC 33500]QCQ75333.1 radical SAM/SPASM domain-containing protein [Haloferax mediterranei ATCC 33500]